MAQLTFSGSGSSRPPERACDLPLPGRSGVLQDRPVPVGVNDAQNLREERLLEAPHPEGRGAVDEGSEAVLQMDGRCAAKQILDCFADLCRARLGPHVIPCVIEDGHVPWVGADAGIGEVLEIPRVRSGQALGAENLLVLGPSTGRRWIQARARVGETQP